MILLISRSLDFCLKIGGFLPSRVQKITPSLTAISVVTIIPFQFWVTVDLLENPLLLMDSLSLVFAEVLIVLKFMMLWKNKRYVTSLLQEIYAEWDNDKLPEKWKTLGYYSRIFSTIDFCMHVTANALYYPEMLRSYINKPVSSRKLFLGAIYPFDYLSSPAYEMINLMQMFQTMLFCFVNVVNKALLVALILHVSAHVETFKDTLEDYSIVCANKMEKRDKTLNNLYIKSLVTEHLKILSLVQRIDAIYSYISMLQIVLSTLLICLTEFVIIIAMQELTDVVLLCKFIVYIVLMFSEAFALCFAGQYLRNKGDTIIDKIYACLWYNTEPNDIKSIMFILARAQIPLTLTGGKLFELSSGSFTMIMKTAASYMSVLRAIYV